MISLSTEITQSCNSISLFIFLQNCRWLLCFLHWLSECIFKSICIQGLWQLFQKAEWGVESQGRWTASKSPLPLNIVHIHILSQHTQNTWKGITSDHIGLYWWRESFVIKGAGLSHKRDRTIVCHPPTIVRGPRSSMQRKKGPYSIQKIERCFPRNADYCSCVIRGCRGINFVQSTLLQIPLIILLVSDYTHRFLLFFVFKFLT